MSNPAIRVNIPTNPKELLTLADKVNKKHIELGTESPLNAMVSHKWSDNGPKVEEAARLQVLAEDLKRQSEEANNKRNALLGAIDDSVKASRDLLLGVYRETPKVLSEFGFDITDSVKSPKTKQA